MIVALLCFLAFAFGWYDGFQRGYRKGFDASEFEHDFDRCKHCGEAPWFEESDEEIDE